MPASPSASKPTSARRVIRQAALATLLVVVVLGGWYTVFRVHHWLRPIVVPELEPPRTTGGHDDWARVRIASWNVAHGRGSGTDASNYHFAGREQLIAHLDELAAQLADSGADVVVLNEVDFDSSWSFGIDEAEHIARAAGYPYLVEQANMDMCIPFRRWRFGNAVLSRIPVVRTEFVRFQPLNRWEAWLAGNHDGLLVELQGEEVGLTVFAVHLEYRDEATRVAAAERIAQVAARTAGPFVAAGDFNSSPPGHRFSYLDPTGANAISLLVDNWGFTSAFPIAEDAARHTFPAEQPNRTIDWILGAGVAGFADPAVVPSLLSDHLMIRADLLMSAPAGATSSRSPEARR